MPDRRDPPPTAEGWYALHDFRRIDWDAWAGAPERDREEALEAGVGLFEDLVSVDDADEGTTAAYAILGHKADLLLVHLRPETHQLDAIERRTETSDFARFADRTTSYVSVTEASGYSERAREYFEGDLDEGSGLARYIRSRLHPDIPDWEHVCFYPMDKRRDPGQNWYDLPFDERAEHMAAHGDIGRDYGGRVTQMITGSIGLDDWEWGVTLWADDLVDVKDLLYEMRFDPSTSQFADFGPFYVGRRIHPADLPALFAGEPIADPETDGSATRDGEVAAGTDDADPDAPSGGPPVDADAHADADVEAVEVHVEADEIAKRLTTLGLAGDFDGGHAVVCYSTADAQAVADAVDDLRGSFDHYDTHRGTAVRAQGGQTAVVSVWATASAADIAAGFLTDLPEVVESLSGPLPGDGGEATAEAGDDGEAGEAAEDAAESIRSELADIGVYAGQPHGEDVYALVVYSDAPVDDLAAEVADLSEGFDRYDTHEGTDVYVGVDGDAAAVVSLWATESAADTAGGYLGDLPGIVGWADDGDGFGTMGMFYTVKPEHREEFVDTFDDVGDLLADMEGHRETTLLRNVDDENDMFIASRWDAREDAMAFFRSDAFSDTVAWGRDVLADRPRHVFLA